MLRSSPDHRHLRGQDALSYRRVIGCAISRSIAHGYRWQGLKRPRGSFRSSWGSVPDAYETFEEITLVWRLQSVLRYLSPAQFNNHHDGETVKPVA